MLGILGMKWACQWEKVVSSKNSIQNHEKLLKLQSQQVAAEKNFWHRILQPLDVECIIKVVFCDRKNRLNAKLLPIQISCFPKIQNIIHRLIINIKNFLSPSSITHYQSVKNWLKRLAEDSSMLCDANMLYNLYDITHQAHRIIKTMRQLKSVWTQNIS